MNIAVIFAGGVGKRMKNPELPKQFIEINDTPIIIHTLKKFQNNNFIDAIIVVVLKDYIEYTQKLISKYDLDKVVKIVEGGKTGQESIYQGLLAAKDIAKNSNNPIVLIHDGVRPIIESDLIKRSVESVREYGSAISCVPSKETIIQINAKNNVRKTIDRSKIWLARAPQSFYLEDILKAHKKAIRKNDFSVIDSCTMMEKYSDKKLHIIETCPENLKVTTPEDLYIIKGLLSSEKIK